MKVRINKEGMGKKIIEVVVEELETELLEKIKETREKDKEAVKVVEEIKRAEIKTLREDEWEIRENLVLKKEKIYILKDKKLRLEVIWLHHDIPVAEYREREI